MPIIAESEPIPLNIGQPSTPTPAIPISPTPLIKCGEVLNRHRQFIEKVDSLQACFVRKDLPGFTDDEFSLHLQIATIDKYLVNAGNDHYCSNIAVTKLLKALERQGV